MVKYASPEPVDTPFVECQSCLSRMIWPNEYRPEEMMMSYECASCNSGEDLVVDERVSLNDLKLEDGRACFLNYQPLGKRSEMKLADYRKAWEKSDATLLFSGISPRLYSEHRRPILNSVQIIEELKKMVWAHASLPSFYEMYPKKTLF